MSTMLLSAAKGRPTLADVLPNCRAALRGESGSLGLPAVRAAVVVLVDGLGAAMLKSRAGHARHIVRDWSKSQRAFSFPSTTVAGITSLTTGTPAGAHGLCGYQLFDRATGELRNQISGWGEAMPPETWQLRPTLFERMRAEGEARAVVVGRREYASSGLTRASLRGADYVVGESMEDRVDATLRAVEGDRALVYCYIAELDQAGHKHGWESDAWLARLEEADAALGRLERDLPDDVGLIITADHGMIDVPAHRQIELPTDSPLLDGVIAVAGEPRLRHLMLADEALPSEADRLAARWNDLEGHRALALTRAEAIAAEWYGPSPLVDSRAAARIGDVVVAARKSVTYYGDWMQGRERAVIGQHGSITDEETIVPLVRKGAFAV